ncbi:MAG: hypothetical protein MRY72_06385 [Aquisalinus sp.]|nr:hypothetical protein [Aquisalinus sp.]
MGATITLFRPVGEKELELIVEANYRAFPPRLPEQPIFYPVTNEEYAAQIARDWNTKYNDEKTGYVTKFNVDSEYVSKFERKCVGSTEHEELWVPAEELEEFNASIVGKIEVIQKFTEHDRLRAEGKVK